MSQNLFYLFSEYFMNYLYYKKYIFIILYELYIIYFDKTNLSFEITFFVFYLIMILLKEIKTGHETQVEQQAIYFS